MSRNPMPPGRHEQALQQAGWTCQASSYRFHSLKECAGRLNVHHRRLRGTGGTSDPGIHNLDNLCVLCTIHHNEAHDHPTRAYECGLMIRRTTP